MNLWLQEHDDDLRLLWADNLLSAALIAVELNEKYATSRFTRNSVIGRAYRLLLGKRRRTPQRKAPPKPSPDRVAPFRPSPRAPVVAQPLSVEDGISLMELEHGRCRDVLGQDAQGIYRYCGLTAATSIDRWGRPVQGSWCAAHHALYTRSS